MISVGGPSSWNLNSHAKLKYLMLENASMSRFLLPVSGLWSYPFGIERREGRNCLLQRAELGSPQSSSLIQVNTLGVRYPHREGRRSQGEAGLQQEASEDWGSDFFPGPMSHRGLCSSPPYSESRGEGGYGWVSAMFPG